MKDAEERKLSSHIFRHWAISHRDDTVQPVFQFKVVKSHKSALDRQLHEAVRITSHGALNARAEFRQNKIERVAVSLTTREQRAADKVTEREEAETLAAVQVLSTKLDQNKLVKTIPSNPTFSDHLDCVSLVEFADTNGKRALVLGKDKSLDTNKTLNYTT